ncbi:MAG TPA: bifunctional ADP-dependent NAD(P)H-hydrate dehydratase/NAD(P)H-hydrate epimerase, partial [Prolixibacteraceae bacterium]|nr:bifunctional ADP-dependent NAD(P)H-hydrate dehydratase/NAD(P)H-hydrate epimerase [Prolixibacteraceae bacterium]
MKLFTCKQIAEIDQLTMKLEPISSIDLMERASMQVADWIINHIGNNLPFWFFAGPGNNGGDALAVARMLAYANFNCTVFIVSFGKELSGDPAINMERLKEQNKVLLKSIDSEATIPEIPSKIVIIDGLFGSGLTRPLNGLAAEIVRKINQSGAMVISIDIPSGLMGEDNSHLDLSNIINARHTLTFEVPKISFLFPETQRFVGNWEVLPIGWAEEAILQTESKYGYLTGEFISSKIQKRDKFSHKGTFGHALLIAGSYGKMGAAILASRACLRSGVGLLTTHIPRLGYQILQSSIPEAMASIDASDRVFTAFPDLKLYSAIGIGPGIDKKTDTQQALQELLYAKPIKMVIDADALNILSENQQWYRLLPPNTILTPHPKELERLVGPSANSYERLQIQLQFSAQYKVIVLCKGAHTCITFPNGQVYFNGSGNAGMATGGSGDVLTGII